MFFNVVIGINKKYKKFRKTSDSTLELFCWLADVFTTKSFKTWGRFQFIFTPTVLLYSSACILIYGIEKELRLYS